MTNLHAPAASPRRFLATALLLCALPLGVHAAVIDQTVASTSTSTAWDGAVWGTPAAAPTGGNTYRVVAGTITSSDTKLLSGGALAVTGRIRAYSSAGATFAGDSLEIVAGTELLLKENVGTTYSANIVLDSGGIVRLSPATAGSFTLAGTLNIAGDSYIGAVHSGACSLLINSTLTGAGDVRLLGGDGGAHTIGFGGDLSAFTGTLDIGGGVSKITVDFNQAYNLGRASLVMRSGTADILNLDGDMTVGVFSFSGTALNAGTYTVADLNGMFGNGSQFTGVGSLTIAAIPEPGMTALLFGCVALLAVSRRRARRQTC